MSYTDYQLRKVYREIDAERRHVCNCCGTDQCLSHSHLIKKSWSHKFVLVKDLIVYHCQDRDGVVGCHNKYESMQVVTMQDFEDNFRRVHQHDRTYFWLRIHKLLDHWQGSKWFARLRKLADEIDKLEHL